MSLEKISWVAGIVSAVLATIGIFFTLPLYKQDENRVTVDRVFRTVKIGSTLQYLEHLIGPPKQLHRYDDRSHMLYSINGCWLFVDADKENNISSLRASITDECSFGWDAIFSSDIGLPPPEKLHFADVFDTGLSWSVSVDCLTLCGNAYEPPIDLRFGGSHADNWLIYVLSAQYGTKSNSEGFDALQAWIESEKGGDFVLSEKYKCDYDLNKAARETTGILSITFFEIRRAEPGERTPGLNQRCL